MGVPVEFWCETLRAHPLLYKFQGLSGYHKTVGDAAVADERFMDNYMYKEYESHVEGLEKAIKERKDLDEYLSRYCEFLECEVSHHEWMHEELLTYDWNKVDDETLMKVIDAVGTDNRKEKFIRDYCIGDIDQYWEMIRDDCEYLLKEHPPERVKEHASGDSVVFEDVFFLCPSCHREPQTLEERAHSLYCGLCGGESCLDKNETMLDFFENLEVQVWPFDERKRKHWEEHFAGYDDVPEEERVEWYANKLKTWSHK